MSVFFSAGRWHTPFRSPQKNGFLLLGIHFPACRTNLWRDMAMEYESQVHTRLRSLESNCRFDGVHRSFSHLPRFACNSADGLAQFFPDGSTRILWRIPASRLDGLGDPAGSDICLGHVARDDSRVSRIRIRSSGSMDLPCAHCCHRAWNGGAFDYLPARNFLRSFCGWYSFLLRHECGLLAHGAGLSTRLRRPVDVAHNGFAGLPALMALFP